MKAQTVAAGLIGAALTLTFEKPLSACGSGHVTDFYSQDCPARYDDYIRGNLGIVPSTYCRKFLYLARVGLDLHLPERQKRRVSARAQALEGETQSSLVGLRSRQGEKRRSGVAESDLGVAKDRN
jgi:hypothetical protein